MKELTKNEETLLLVILQLKNNAYGVAIKQQHPENQRQSPALWHTLLYLGTTD
jgi:hypothetical protein